MARSSSSQPLTTEDYLSLHFPKAGLDLSCPAAKQTKRGTAAAGYIYTTADGSNVRAYTAANRFRGCSRPGLAKYIPQAVGGVTGWIVQELNLLVTSGITAPGGSMEASQSGRVVLIVGVSKGNVSTAVPGGAAWTDATNNAAGDPPLNFSGLVMSAPNGQKMYFADGTHWVYYDPATDSVEDWTASAGSLPVDGSGNTPRLICTWRGRTVLSGLLKDQQNWFMSAVGDPTDFDYSPLSTSALMAVAGNNGPQGVVGDMVTALVPWSDDVLIFGCDHSIWRMSGDPANGGTLDNVSDVIGFAWGQAWCKGPDGTVYFMSNRGGVYAMAPNSLPVQLSQPIQNRMLNTDTGLNGVRLAWDERWGGFHMFVTALGAPEVTDHYFYEARQGAWWVDRLGSTSLDPLCCCVMDGNLPSDRVVIMGSWSGYVYFFDPDAEDDDGNEFTSTVTIGPILTQNFDDMLLKDMQAILGANSGTVTWAVFAGRTAEEARVSTARAFGTWTEFRSLTENVRVAGHAIYVRLSSTEPWSMESIRARFAGRGKIRGRARD